MSTPPEMNHSGGALVGTGPAATAAPTGEEGGDANKSSAIKNMSQFCIGEIEPELHKAFANMRTPLSRDYVYGEPEDLFQQLDEFCDPASMHYQCPPLVVCGPSGVGKSALLSNWYRRRINNRRKHSNNDDVATHKEFIFWHVVGCSRISCMMAHMLRRLETELREHFDLTREVSKDEGRLRWDLPTFLEMAARKGRVILMIDGIHRMRDADGEEDLKWLPLEYPGNVRLIVSTTTYPEEGGEAGAAGRRNKSLIELRRRQWDLMEVKELSNKARKEILMSYLRLTYEKAHSISRAAHDGGSSTSTSASNMGLVLFPSHHKSILTSQAATNPLFLRVLLKALHWSALRGFDVWRVFNDWAQAESIYELYERILNTWESGLESSAVNMEDADKAVMKEGGFGALGRKHPWLQATEDASTVSSFYSRDQGHRDHDMHEGEEDEGDDAPVHVADELPLAEVQWRQAHAEAEKAIADARVQAERAGAELLHKVALAASKGNKPAQYPNEKVVEYLVGHKGDVATEGGSQDSARSKRSEASAYNDEGFEDEEHRPPSRSLGSAGKADTAGRLSLAHLPDLDDVSLPPASSSSGSNYSSHPGGSHSGSDARSSLHSSSTGQASIPILHVPGQRDDDVGASFSPQQLGQGSVDDDSRTRNGSISVSGSGSNSNGVSRLSKQDVQLLPRYFRGGESMEGFGSVLGNALAVLYVARHGLTADELTKLLVKLRESSDRKLCGAMWKQREILTDMFREVDPNGGGLIEMEDIRSVIMRLDPKLRASKLDRLVKMSRAIDARDDHMVYYEKLIEYCGTVFRADQPMEVRRTENSDDLKGLSGSVDGSQASVVTLGDTMEESLLSVLIALGVMHSPEDKVLVLTLESEALREVVRRRYVKNDEGEERWHNAIMKYFQAQPSSLRRCEELPWHLHICRRWTALKDALSDLWAFEIMYRGKLKNEFFQYWRTLTEGPLFVSEDYEAAVKNLGANTTALLLNDLDTAAVMNYTDQRMEKEKLRGQMATFDMIDCYNQAIEHWRSEVRPSTHTLSRMLELIGSFMAEFYEVVRVDHPTPLFLRKPLVYESMHAIGIEEAKYLPLREKSAAANAAPTAIKDGPYRDLTPEQFSLLKHNEGYYYFKRWLWVQFPWIALANTELAMRLYGGDTNVVLPPPDPTAAAPDVITARGQQRLGNGSHASAVVQAQTSASTTTVPRSVESTATFMRMWNVKKRDPNACKPRTHADEIQFNTMIKACSLHMAPVAEKADILVQNALADKSAISIRLATRHFDPTPKPKGQGLPLGGSSLKALKYGTRVPSVERLLKQSLEEQSKKMDLITATAIHRFGGQEAPGSVKEILEAMEDTSTLYAVPCMGVMGSHTYAMPITVKEKEFIEFRSRIASLRGVLDRVRLEKINLQRKLVDLLRQAAERESQDLVTVERIETGEVVIEALQDRVLRMNAAVTEAESLGKFYKLVLAQIARNPAKDNARLECLDQQLSLANVQLRDLTRERQAVYLDKEKIEKEELRKAQLTLDQINRDREKCRQRVLAVRKKPGASAMGGTGNPQAGDGLGTSNSPANANNADKPLSAGVPGLNTPADRRPNGRALTPQAPVPPLPDMPKSPTEAGRPETRMGGSSLAAKDSETLRSCMEKLFEFAGTEEVSVVIEKIVNSQRLGEGLMEQCKDYEATVGELKVELSKTERKLQDVNVDGGGTPDDSHSSTASLAAATGNGGSESHNIEESQFREEMRCLKARRAMLTAHQFLDQVKTGVNHLARLVARYSTNLTVAALRSPDGFHEEKYEDGDVIKVLSVFEERITAMKEAVAMDMNEKLDNAGNTVSSTKMLQTGTTRDEDMGTMHLLLKNKKGGTTANNPGATLEAVHHVPDPNLLGIDVDILMHMKREKHGLARDKGGCPASLSSSIPKDPVTKGKLLKHATERLRVRVKAYGVLDNLYDQAVQEVVRRRDEATDRLEAEADNKTVESVGGTENFIRQALSCKESQHELRRTAIRELEVNARQYPDNDEGMGISLEQALTDTQVQLGRFSMLGGGGTSSSATATGGGNANVGGRRAGGGPTAGAEKKSASGKKDRNAVISREECKAMSAALLAKLARAGKAKGDGGSGDDRSEGTTLPPVRTV